VNLIIEDYVIVVLLIVMLVLVTWNVKSSRK
jgi:TRAP-type C4-dicarboxylate transport system permease small subunit